MHPNTGGFVSPIYQAPLFVAAHLGRLSTAAVYGN